MNSSKNTFELKLIVYTRVVQNVCGLYSDKSMIKMIENFSFNESPFHFKLLQFSTVNDLHLCLKPYC